MYENLKCFFRDISVPETYQGMKSLLRRYFILTIFDVRSCLRVAVDIEESVCIELRKEKRADAVVWNCIYQNADDFRVLWSVSKERNSTYYGNPVVYEDEIALLLQNVLSEGFAGEFARNEA